ncbi:hypothetical protein QQ045_019787 [Rhodiola kirilowii]
MSLTFVLLFLLPMSLGGFVDAQFNNYNKRGPSFFTKQQVVKGLDLKRYTGRWYEIAKYPSIFEPRNGENTRATYTLKADGNIDVLNETFLKGKKVSIKGYAYKADPNSDEAKLKVKFDFLPFRGDYWVLHVDADYQYAVVGHPFRISLFILSRENKIDDQVYNRLRQKAAEQGYDVDKLTKTTQTDPPPS